MVISWLRAWRRTEPTAAAIRAELRALHHQRAVTVAQQGLLALDAVHDPTTARRWQDLGDTTTTFDQRIALLEEALPQAEARDAEAARLAEERRRAAHADAFERQTAEAQAFTDAVLASLPDGPTLTKARDLRDAIRHEAAMLRTWSDALNVRRPVDPLRQIVDALKMRLQRADRSRWIGSSPITLADSETHEAMMAATTRVANLNPEKSA